MSKKMSEDVRARFKHQTLLQDYLELQRETEAVRNQLVAVKRKKKTLEAEVRFLKRRHRFLLKTKSITSQEVKLQSIETSVYKKIKKDDVNLKKAATLLNFPLIPKQIQSGKPKGRNVHSHAVNLNQRVHGSNSSPGTEFNKKEDGFSGKEALVTGRAPLIDLNQISMEEEEEMEGGFEDQRKEEQNDLMLTGFRNVGDGSMNRSGKRKISWQDPVALRV